jgi:uncharacterized protein YegJ (DUF2314 family)
VRTSTLYLIILLLSGSTSRAQDVKKQTDENMYYTESGDTAMNLAIATAKKTFPKFDSTFRRPHDKKMYFSIKVRFRYPGGNEYIWMESITLKNGHYWGVITDTPANPIKVKLYEQLEIPSADITDWLCGSGEVLHGGYTIRVINSRMTKAEAEKFKQEFPYRLVD